MIDMGKYVVVWKQEERQWKVHCDIWNRNVPAPTDYKALQEELLRGLDSYPSKALYTLVNATLVLQGSAYDQAVLIECCGTPGLALGMRHSTELGERACHSPFVANGCAQG